MLCEEYVYSVVNQFIIQQTIWTVRHLLTLLLSLYQLF